jgi:DNA-damage-inducible protein J
MYYNVLTTYYKQFIIKLEKRDIMNQSMLSIRVDINDKKSFEAFCNNTGMNVSTAINMFIKTVVREQRIPFEIKSDDYDKEIYQKLLEAEKEMANSNKRYSSEEALENMKKIIG